MEWQDLINWDYVKKENSELMDGISEYRNSLNSNIAELRSSLSSYITHDCNTYANLGSYSDGSEYQNLNVLTTDQYSAYPVIGIDQETMQEAIKRIVEEQFRKAGITPPDETEVQKIEKYKMKHK